MKLCSHDVSDVSAQKHGDEHICTRETHNTTPYASYFMHNSKTLSYCRHILVLFSCVKPEYKSDFVVDILLRTYLYKKNQQFR